MNLQLCFLCALPLNPSFQQMAEEAKTKDLGTQQAGLSVQEKTASVEVARSEFLPTVTLNGETGPSRSYEWRDGTRINTDSEWTWNHQLSATARVNLSNGGATQRRIALSQNETQIAQSEQQKQLAEMYARFFTKIVDLHFAKQRSLLREEQFKQAQELQTIAQRKSKSGFFGSKDVLETQRETSRSELELRSSLQDLERQASEFNIEFGLNQNPIRVTRLPTDTAPLVRHFRDRSLTLDLKSPSEENPKAGALVLGALRLQTESSALELESQRVARWDPSLDLSLGAQYSFLDVKGSDDRLKSVTADRRLSPFATLSFSVSLFAPVAADRVQVAAERASLRKQTEEKQNQDIQKSISKIPDQVQQLQETEKLQLKLIQLSEDLLKSNRRLFDAGELDVRTMIASSQELSAQRERLLEGEQKSSAIGLSLWKFQDLGLTP